MKTNYENGVLVALGADFIRAVRKVLCKSQSDVSKHADITRGVIVEFEHGNRPVVDEHFLQILNGLFRTPEEFAEFLLLWSRNKSWTQLRSECIKHTIDFLKEVQKEIQD